MLKSEGTKIQGRNMRLDEYINYLDKEGGGRYFNSVAKDMVGGEVQSIIGEDDYFSMVISPSANELKHIDDTIKKEGLTGKEAIKEKERRIQAYTQQVVNEYVHTHNTSRKKHFVYFKYTKEYIINDKRNRNNVEAYCKNMQNGKVNIWVGDKEFCDAKPEETNKIDKAIKSLIDSGVLEKNIQINYLKDQYTPNSKPEQYKEVNTVTHYETIDKNTKLEKGRTIFNRFYHEAKLDANQVKWSAKIESNRTYKFEDRHVQNNIAVKALDKKIKNAQSVEDAEKLIKIKLDKYKGYAHENSEEKIVFYSEEKKGCIKEGMNRTGDNTHVHIIISKQDNLGGKHSPFQQFPINKFAQSCEVSFDQMENYNRPENEKMYNKLKNANQRSNYVQHNQQKYFSQPKHKDYGFEAINLNPYNSLMLQAEYGLRIAMNQKNIKRAIEKKDFALAEELTSKNEEYMNGMATISHRLAKSESGLNKLDANHLLNRAYSPLQNPSSELKALLMGRIDGTSVIRQATGILKQAISF
ncbi:MAG: DUF5712 family protein [Phycisphaerales bacterium]|nr:DUF5712 family protein [Phycisphaerales bacterium]